MRRVFSWCHRCFIIVSLNLFDYIRYCCFQLKLKKKFKVEPYINKCFDKHIWKNLPLVDRVIEISIYISIVKYLCD